MAKKIKVKAKTKTKAKRKAKRSKAVKRPGKKTLNFKVKPEEAKAIKLLAKKWTRGNVTALVVGALKYAPAHGRSIAKGEFRATTRK